MLPEWAGNLQLLILVTTLSLIASHLAFWRFPNGRWRQVANYIAVALGGVSLMSAGFQSRAQLADIRYQSLTDIAQSDRERIIEYLSDVKHLTCDIHYRRSNDSPFYFDDLVRDQNLGCQAAQSLIANSQKWITNSDEAISMPPYGQDRMAKKYGRDDFIFVYKAIADYNAVVNLRRAYFKDKKNSEFQIFLSIFGPYLAAIALSIGLGNAAFKQKD